MNADHRKTVPPTRKPATGKLARCAVAAAAAALVLSACEAPASDDKKTSERSYDIKEKATALHMRTAGGDIRVTASGDDTVRVKEKIRYSDDKPQSSHSTSGGVVSISDKGCGKGNCAIDYEIAVPASLKLQLDTDGGDVEVRGASGDVAVATEGGSVKLKDLRSKQTEATTKGGDVELAFRDAPDSVRATTEGGDADITVPKGAYAVDGGTEGGEEKVEVEKDAKSSHSIEARTEGGDVTVSAA
ncbi:DUF4097 family beta strand repeat-containing protein [Streptomyces sp. ODS28]|uniref:DUF4097 family beta strand repeat-containing protein n=1 Tax=Streptomyces sp. ODS28 TaxID=3136688 RepID=UPI0031EF54E8